MNFKKFWALLFVLICGLSFIACDRDPLDEETDNDPVITGADDIEIEKGSNFAPLAGVTAYDEEDGDLTDAIVYTGTVNVNVVGEYTAIYSVTDSDGNTTEVPRIITVILVDDTPPFLTGVDDVELIVGDTDFDCMDGVEANDTIDGNLTEDITVTGEIDPWTLDDYEITYRVSDASDNEKVVVRTVTVSLGEFIFGDPVLSAEEVEFEEGIYEGELPAIIIDGVLADFALAKLTFTAEADVATTLAFTLTNGTSMGEVAVGTDEADYTVYFRINEEFETGMLKLEAAAALSVTGLSFVYGEARDLEPPVISVPAETVVVPNDVTDSDVIKRFVLTGVTANDNIDQIITSRLDVDFGDIVLGEFTGLTEVTIFVSDSSGNRTEESRDVEFAQVRSTNFIKDPTFTDTDISQWGLNSGGGEPVLEVIDGVLTHYTTVDQNPGWDSASSPRLESTTDVFRAGNWYLLKFDVKVAETRKMTVRIGLETTEAAGWIENFAGASNTPINPTTEWQTAYVIFYVHAATSEELGSNVVKMEFKIGTFDWGSNERMNTTYLDNLQFYLLSNENNPPELTLNDELPTTFGKDEPLPDFTEYIFAYDFEDGTEIAVIADYIDASAVDMTTPGEYDVLYAVPDSDGDIANYTLTIKVLAEKDETPPELSEAEDLVKEIDQFTTVDLLSAVVAVDDIDGEIAITEKMITGTVDTAVTGVYEVTYTVRDSSGNESTLVIVFTVNDKEPPKFTGKTEITVVVGDTLNPLAIVSCTDNVDGDIDLTLDHITGFEGYLDLEGTLLQVGTFTLTYTVTDSAGNEGIYEVEVTVNPQGDTELVEDGVVMDILAAQPAIDSGSADMAEVTYDEETGEAHITISDVGGWASAAKMKIWMDELVFDNFYMVKITVKADEARSLAFTVGQSLNSDPWYDKFTVIEDDAKFNISAEYQTYTFIFAYDKPHQANGPAMEFCFGKGDHAGDVAGNDLSISQFEIIKMKEVVLEDVALDILALQPAIDAGSADKATVAYDEETGEAYITITDVGGWESAVKMKIWLDDLEYGKTYTIKITVKADEARSLKFTLGQSLNVDPWYDKFTITDGSEVITISNIDETYYITFVYDKEYQANGPAMEFCFGQGSHAGDVAGNDIYVSEFKLLNVKEEEEPEEPTGEVVLDILADQPEIDAGSATAAAVSYDEESGAAHITVTDVGSWASYAKMKIWIRDLEYGKTYAVKITAKADEARSIKFTAGQSLNSDPWYDKFAIVAGSDVITLSDTYETYYMVFDYDIEYKDNGPALEFCFGKVGHAGDVAGNDLYISAFEILEINN